jgi:2-hydroxy-3-keto-5-methylthiopentenyl-1-phosphate phosphatase
MTAVPEAPVAVLCDFDGTITIDETLGFLYRRFAGEECWDLVQAWMRGELTTPQEMQGCFASMKASRAEMEAALSEVRVDPGFPALVHFCRERGYRIGVLSDGLLWYIRLILNREGFPDLQVYANDIDFLPDRVEIHSPWYDPITPRRGVSKPSIIRKYQQQGYRVIFVGDGLSDVEALGAADMICARGQLLGYCRQYGITAIGFSRMDDLLEKWKTGPAEAAPNPR